MIEFLTALLSQYGLVDEIISDNGPQFVSTQFELNLSKLNIKHYRSALYTPAANGAVERFNRVLKDGIKAAMSDGSTFASAIRQTLANYRSLPQSTTSTSPADLMFRFNMRMPLNKTLHPPDNQLQADETAEKVNTAVQCQQKMASYYN